MATRKKDWTLTNQAFERLLSSLDADRDRAGRYYESLRHKLIEFFEARGSHFPTEDTDETINRVARKLEEGERIEDPSRYFYGVARLVMKETLRAQRKEPMALDPGNLPPVAAQSQEQADELEERSRRLNCLEICLSKLPAANRVFIVDYYREEKGVKIELRKRQAEVLKMSVNALRLRARRIRAELGHCIDSCVARRSEDTESDISH